MRPASSRVSGCWYRGRDSNPQASKAADFKSAAYSVPPPRRRPRILARLAMPPRIIKDRRHRLSALRPIDALPVAAEPDLHAPPTFLVECPAHKHGRENNGFAPRAERIRRLGPSLELPFHGTRPGAAALHLQCDGVAPGSVFREEEVVAACVGGDDGRSRKVEVDQQEASADPLHGDAAVPSPALRGKGSSIQLLLDLREAIGHQLSSFSGAALAHSLFSAMATSS